MIQRPWPWLPIWLLIVIGAVLVPPCHTASGATLPLALDRVLNWADPLSGTESTFLGAFGDELTKDGRRLYLSNNLANGAKLINLGSSARAFYRLTVLGDRFTVESASFTFDNDGTARVWLMLLRDHETVSNTDAVVAKLAQAIGSQPDNSGPIRYSDGSKYDAVAWVSGRAMVRIHERKMRTIIEITPRSNSPRNVTPRESPPSTAAMMNVAVNLDPLLAHDVFWKWTPADFERQYVAKSERQDQPPQFEWLNASKERARFSRKLFSNIDTRLTMFAGSVKVEEAIVEFVNGRAARATVSFYNRGDSGDIAVQEFESIYKRIGQNLGQALKVSPKNQLGSSNAALRVTGWNWTAPTGIALLEYNDYTAQSASGTVQQPEFLRLKLAAPDQADWSMGRLTVGVGRMTIAKNVTRNPAGDVFIAGVPMVDQGAKGYCVAASCQRLFEYFQIPCDQHELANLVSIDVEKGANIFSMQKSLAKIDGQFKVAFKPHINPELYYDNRRKRRVSLKEFSGIVKENTDKGAPLLWALEIGRFKEEPPLPRSGQTGGGHMRIVIGYNSARNQILFTDSWGAGHELKRMDAAEAYECTMGLYSMSPRGL